MASDRLGPPESVHSQGRSKSLEVLREITLWSLDNIRGREYSVLHPYTSHTQASKDSARFVFDRCTQYIYFEPRFLVQVLSACLVLSINIGALSLAFP